MSLPNIPSFPFISNRKLVLVLLFSKKDVWNNKLTKRFVFSDHYLKHIIVILVLHYFMNWINEDVLIIIRLKIHHPENTRTTYSTIDKTLLTAW